VKGTVGRIYKVYTETMRDIKKEKERISRNFDEVGADGETQWPLRPPSPVRLSDITHQISRGS
jgi:hypothetical protein